MRRDLRFKNRARHVRLAFNRATEQASILMLKFTQEQCPTVVNYCNDLIERLYLLLGVHALA